MSNQIKFFQISEYNSVNRPIETIDSLRVFLNFLKLFKLNPLLVFCLLSCLASQIGIRGQDRVPDKKLLAAEKINLLQPLKICEAYSNNNLRTVFASDNEQLNKVKKRRYVYITSGESNVISFDVENNQLLWSTELGGVIVSELVIDNGKIFVITTPEKLKEKYPHIKSDDYVGYSIWTLDENTGITINQTKFNLNAFTSLSINSLENFLLISDDAKNLIKIGKDNVDKNNIKTPYILLELPARLNSPPALLKDRIYAAIETDSILILSAGKNDFFSRLHTIPYGATILNLFDNLLLFGDKNGRITLYDSIHNKIVWRRRFGGKVSSITKIEDSVLLTSLDNFAYLVKLSKGKVLWKKRLSSRVLVKPLVAENLLTVIVDTNNDSYVINLKDGKVVNQISLPENIVAIQSPIDFGKFLIFPTNKGLYKVVNQDEKCPPN